MINTYRRRRLEQTPRRMRILVADTDRELRNAVSSYMRVLGVDVLTADSGYDALSLAFAHEPHAVVLDTKLPGMDGYQVAESLRAVSQTASLPIVMCSAQPARRNRRWAVDSFVQKPCAPAMVARQLQRLLGAPLRLS